MSTNYSARDYRRIVALSRYMMITQQTAITARRAALVLGVSVSTARRFLLKLMSNRDALRRVSLYRKSPMVERHTYLLNPYMINSARHSLTFDQREIDAGEYDELLAASIRSESDYGVNND